jgi:hypothetical protein
LPYRALGPDPASVPVNNALHRGQSDPGSWELAHIVKTLEGTEKLVGVSHVESDAIILHKVDLLSIRAAASEFDAGFRLSRGKLPRISEQVLQHNSQ